MGGLGLSNANHEKLEQDESHEALYDIAEIAKLKYEELLTESGEDSEVAFMELVEYVRIAVLLIYTENIEGRDSSSKMQH